MGQLLDSFHWHEAKPEMSMQAISYLLKVPRAALDVLLVSNRFEERNEFDAVSLARRLSLCCRPQKNLRTRKPIFQQGALYHRLGRFESKACAKLLHFRILLLVMDNPRLFG